MSVNTESQSAYTANAAPHVSLIPPGEGIRGEASGVGDPDELPWQTIRVEGFELGSYTVTNHEYAAFLNDLARQPNRDGARLIGSRYPACGIEKEGSTYTVREGREFYPVTYVPWRGAVAYCDWLSRTAGGLWRLPTEDEWQYASDGPEGWVFALGNKFESSEYITGRDEPGPVDTGKASPFGLFNITGNVFEWCHDEYTSKLGVVATVQPQNRVIKGGAFVMADSANFRNAKRFAAHEESANASIGFRVVRELGCDVTTQAGRSSPG